MDIFKNSEEKSNQWISISDLMAGLMMVFLFIAISYMLKVVNEKEKIKQIAVTYDRLQNDLYQDLHNEFKSDLKKWNAEIDSQTLAVRFKAPEVLFRQGSYHIRDKFKRILNDFFPRYIDILTNKTYKKDIAEIRIEGHTSSEWKYGTNEDKAYILNMRLSQNRTRSVLNYVLNLPEISKYKDWVQKNLTANGLSSSKPIIINGREHKKKSRRVEFRVRTNAEKRIVKILSESKN